MYMYDPPTKGIFNTVEGLAKWIFQFDIDI